MSRIPRDVVPGRLAAHPPSLVRPLALGACWDLDLVRHAGGHELAGPGVTAAASDDPRSADSAYRFGEDPWLAAASAAAYAAGRARGCRCPEAAREVARGGIVLLRNGDGVLPLRPGSRVAVTESRMGVDLAGALRARHGEVEVTSASRADAVVAVLAEDPYALGAGSVAIFVGRGAGNPPAALWSADSGAGLGPALADVLLGRTAAGVPVEPAGRLPRTSYRSHTELPDPGDPGGDITYQRFRGTPRYAFGHGLGYTRFAHRRARLDAEILEPGGTAALSVDVLNIGARPGAEVVQVYSSRRGPDRGPLRRLRRFARVHVDPGGERTVTFRLGHEEFEEGRHTLTVGRSCLAVTGSVQITLRGR